MRDETRQPNFIVPVGLAWLIVAAQLLAVDWNNATRTLLDTDDALRLVQVREFIAGQSWFNLHEARFGPPQGYDSHWSRLIDAGLAGFFLFFNTFTNAELAERLMRVVWPVLWLFPAICAVAALAWRIARREAALAVLLLVVFGMPAFDQFRPGRIDHHNVQIVLALATLAASAWADKKSWAAALAGGLTGLAFAIGLESLPFLLVGGAAVAARYVVDHAGAESLRRYGLALALSMLVAFFISVGPDHWNLSVCDALAINWMAPVVTAGLLLAAASWFQRNAAVRGGAIAGIAVLAAGIFVVLEPRCLGGPFAMMDLNLRPIWLSHISEMQPLLLFLSESPKSGARILAFPAIAVVATLWLARDWEMRRSLGFLLNGAALLLAAAMSMAVVKFGAYAIWIGMPLVAAWSLVLFERFRLTTFAARSLLVVLLAPTTVSAVGIAIAWAGGGGNAAEAGPRVGGGCFESANYAQLARLPKGLVVSDLDYGPFILALTSHVVLAGPYHRLPQAIREAHRSFAEPPAVARQLLARLGAAYGATYLVTCGDYALIGVTESERANSLWAHISAGDIPAWLEQVPAENGQVFTVYRVNATVR